MAPKKKGKKGKKGKKDKKLKEGDTMTAVDRTFYELTITDLNNKLARLRSHVAKIEGSNDEMIEKMRQYEEDRTDVTAYLDRQLTEKIDMIRDLDERILELQKVREEENKANEEIIRSWENKYKAMYEQLTSEIKLLNGKLNSLEEFRLQRADLLMKFDEQEAEMRELRRLQREKIHEMEQKAIIEKDKLKKEVEAKLLELSEDFTKSSEIRIAGYTRRLIRENIALNKEMDRMVQSQLRMEEENKKMKERFIEIEHSHSNSNALKERLMRTCQNQIEVIEQLTQQYEGLQNKYHKITHYKKLYETSLKRDICDTFSYNEMVKKQRIMAQRIEKLKVDKQKLISLHQQHEMEVIRLQNILLQIKFTVQSGIRGEIDDTDDPEFRAAQRKNLLTELMNILTTYSDEITAKPSVSTISDASSIYRRGFAGLTPKETVSLLELFKRKAKKIASAELYLPAFKPKPFDGKITPQERSLESETLIDVRSGSTIVFSTSSSGEEPPPGDDALEEQGDFGSSSSAATLKESKTSVSEAEKKKEKMKEKAKEKEKAEKVKAASAREEEKVVKETEVEHEPESKVSLGKEEHAALGESDIEAESAALFEAMTEADEEEDEAGYFFY